MEARSPELKCPPVHAPTETVGRILLCVFLASGAGSDLCCSSSTDTLLQSL